MLDDDWLRIQVYVPERVRYHLRQHAPDWKTDSRIVRDILYFLCDMENEEFLEEILKK